MGVMLLNTCQAIGEMAIIYPVSGGFYTLISRFVDPSWGFAMGWNYWYVSSDCQPGLLVSMANFRLCPCLGFNGYVLYTEENPSDAY